MFEKLFHRAHRTPETAPLLPADELTPAEEVVSEKDPTIDETRQKVAGSFAGNHFIDGAMVGPVHARPGSFLDNGFFRR